MKSNKRIVLDFIQTVKELRQAVVHRKTKELREYQSKFIQYRRNFEDILDYLSNLNENGRYLEIYLEYISQLSQLNKILYYTTNNKKRYKEQQDGLLRSMEVYANVYPQIKGEVFCRVEEEIIR